MQSSQLSYQISNVKLIMLLSYHHDCIHIRVEVCVLILPPFKFKDTTDTLDTGQYLSFVVSFVTPVLFYPPSNLRTPRTHRTRANICHRCGLWGLDHWTQWIQLLVYFWFDLVHWTQRIQNCIFKSSDLRYGHPVHNPLVSYQFQCLYWIWCPDTPDTTSTFLWISILVSGVRTPWTQLLVYYQF